MAGVAQLVRASVCETEGCEFKSRRSPHGPLAQLVRASASGAEGSTFKSWAGCQVSSRLCSAMVSASAS